MLAESLRHVFGVFPRHPFKVGNVPNPNVRPESGMTFEEISLRASCLSYCWKHTGFKQRPADTEGMVEEDAEGSVSTG